MDWISTLDDLHSHYGQPKVPALRKVSARLTPAYRRFIEATRFCILSTIGPEGTDGSPRGDQGPVVMVEDDETLLLPDWQGNDRIDSLRNIVRDGRVSLYFMVTGSPVSLRVNGTARLTADVALRKRFDRDGKHPRSVMVIRLAEVYSQCSRAIQRSELWTALPVEGLPSFGQMLEQATVGEIDGAGYDRDRAGRAHLGWW
jgi:PPOX class probable FMN-dependent enzyme